MSALIKNSVFFASKYLGLFAISRWILRNKVRVLCYHAFTTIDEHLNVPGLFIEPEVFADRLNYLERKGYKVIGLDEAYQDVSRGVEANNRVVITIDDGFVSVLRKAAPILKQYDFPSTLYLTSYFFDKNCPVFTLAVGYMFWKTEASNADFSSLQIPALSAYKDCPLTEENKNKIAIAIKEHGQPLKGNEKRVELLEKLGEILNVDYHELNKNRLFNIVNKQELDELQQHGVDIQLHTHRHTFPADQEIAKKEIRDNKDAINPLLEKPMKHFCYPSGVWSERHWDALSQEQVLTATTCQIGLVDEKTPQYAWPRILDSARVSQIEFEAEVSGFNELLRMARS
jgi:peptidoglycan/xylan/chitin deacetylase (PgdA/CDA1 family)